MNYMKMLSRRVLELDELYIKIRLCEIADARAAGG